MLRIRPKREFSLWRPSSKLGSTMLIKKAAGLRHSDVTPRHAYLNRRRFLTALPAAGAAFGVPWAGAAMKLGPLAKSPFSTDEKITPFEAVSHYNNYYEFGTYKEDPRKPPHTSAHRRGRSRWREPFDKPKVFDLDSADEDRAARRAHLPASLRGGAGPWWFPGSDSRSSALIKQVEPLRKAKYVAFQTL